MRNFKIILSVVLGVISHSSMATIPGQTFSGESRSKPQDSMGLSHNRFLDSNISENCTFNGYNSLPNNDKKAVIDACVEIPLDKNTIMVADSDNSLEDCTQVYDIEKINRVEKLEDIYSGTCLDRASLYKDYQWRLWSDHINSFSIHSIETTSDEDNEAILFPTVSQKLSGGDAVTSLAVVKYKWDLGGGYSLPFVLLTNNVPNETADGILSNAADSNGGLLNLKFSFAGKARGTKGMPLIDYSHTQKGGLYGMIEGGFKADRSQGASEGNLYTTGYLGALVQLEMPIYEESNAGSRAGTFKLGAMFYGLSGNAGEVEKYLTVAGLDPSQASKMEADSWILTWWAGLTITNELNISYRRVASSTNDLYKALETVSIDYQALEF